MKNSTSVDVRKINIDICEALGLDPMKIRKIVLTFGAIPECEVTFVPETKDVTGVLRRYELVEK